MYVPLSQKLGFRKVPQPLAPTQRSKQWGAAEAVTDGSGREALKSITDRHTEARPPSRAAEPPRRPGESAQARKETDLLLWGPSKGFTKTLPPRMSLWL